MFVGVLMVDFLLLVINILLIMLIILFVLGK